MTDPEPNFDFFDTHWEIRTDDDRVLDQSSNQDDAYELLYSIAKTIPVLRLVRVETYTAEFEEII